MLLMLGRIDRGQFGTGTAMVMTADLQYWSHQ